MDKNRQQDAIANLSLEYMARQLLSQAESLRERYPDHLYAFRYMDANYCSRYADSKKENAKATGQTPEQQLDIRNLVGDPGSKYMESSHNHSNLRPDDKYVFLYPLINEAQIMKSLMAIRDQKFRSSATQGVEYFACLILVDPAVKEEMKRNPNGALSHYGHGMYDVDGVNFSLEEIALHCQDFNPEGFIHTTQFLDPYVAGQIALGEDLNFSNLGSLKDYAEEQIEDSADISTADTYIKTNKDKYGELRDFCDYVAAAHGLTLQSSREADFDYVDPSEVMSDVPEGCVVEETNVDAAAKREVVEIIESLLANNSSPKEIKEVLAAYSDGFYDQATIEAAARQCGVAYGSVQADAKLQKKVMTVAPARQDDDYIEEDFEETEDFTK